MRYVAICFCMLASANCVAKTREQAVATTQRTSSASTRPAELATAAGRPEPATEAFQRGARLVDRNCGECMGATAQGLVEGIESLKKAIQLGYPGLAAAHRLLRDAYGEMGALIKTPDGAEGKRYDLLRRSEIAEIVKVDPSDLANRLDFISQMPPSEAHAQMASLQKLVAEHPEFPAGQYALAKALFAAGANAEALRHAERWLVAAKGREARDGAVSLLDVVSVDDLRVIVSTAPKFHPALFALALRLLREGPTAEAPQLARRALEEAPPSIASAYADQLSPNLEAAKLGAAAQTLRRDFSSKLQKGEAENKREQ